MNTNSEQHDSHPQTFVLVADKPTDVEGIREYLEDRGFSVLDSCDGTTEIVRLEQEPLEHRMTRGFAQEMRNVLTGPKALLENVIGAGETICQETNDMLERVFESIQDKIPQRNRPKLLRHLQHIEQNEKRLHHILTVITPAIAHAMKVIDLMSEYSQLGQSECHTEDVFLNEIIEHTLQKHRLRLENLAITCRLHLSDTSLIKGCAAHFQTIFAHIILNACDAFEERDMTGDRILDISLIEQEHHLITQIQDNATGMCEETLQKIFTPFFSTKSSNGIGLGLNFVSKLVRLYHGMIDVQSEVEQYTVFTITLPLRATQRG